MNVGGMKLWTLGASGVSCPDVIGPPSIATSHPFLLGIIVVSDRRPGYLLQVGITAQTAPVNGFRRISGLVKFRPRHQHGANRLATFAKGTWRLPFGESSKGFWPMTSRRLNLSTNETRGPVGYAICPSDQTDTKGACVVTEVGHALNVSSTG